MKRFASLCLDLFAGPIPVRELRATFRGWRFVILFTSALVMALFVLWMTAFGMEQDRMAASSIGQSLFGVLVAIQAAIIALLVPGFAGTSIVREKDKSTLELLSTTTIQPWQIVWGQFMAAMGYVAVYLFATLPIMALPFWYGGLSGWEPLVAYAGLFLFAALIAIWGIYASATSQTIARAVGMSYIFVFLGGFPLAGALYEIIDRAMRGRGDITEIIDAISRNASFVTIDAAYAFLAPFTFFFIVAVNRLKPAGSNRSTSLRIFATFFLPAAAAVILFNAHHFFRPSEMQDRYNSAYGWWFFIAFTGTLMAFFAAEGAIDGKRLFKQLDTLKGVRVPLRVFAPGGRRGFAFTLLSTAFVLLWGGPFVMRLLAWESPDPFRALWLTAGTVLAQVVFASGLALWLGSLRIPAVLARALCVFAIAAVPLGSVFWQFAAFGEYPDSGALAWKAPGYLCFPVVLWGVWRGEAWPGGGAFGHGALMPIVGRSTPIWVPFWIFHFGLGITMALLGAIAEWQRERENREALAKSDAAAGPSRAAKPVPVEAAP
ncbi:MAG: ABC transporter permease [Planctomycetes bacterium]|nr:ABC transporter permease [Planctomycetota bacterium]